MKEKKQYIFFNIKTGTFGESFKSDQKTILTPQSCILYELKEVPEHKVKYEMRSKP